MNKPQDLRRIVNEVTAEHLDAARGGAGQPKQQFKGGGLPSPIGPKEAVDTALRDFKTDLVDNSVVSITLSQPGGTDQHVHASHRTATETAEQSSTDDTLRLRTPAPYPVAVRRIQAEILPMRTTPTAKAA